MNAMFLLQVLEAAYFYLQVLLDGVDIRSLHLPWLRSLIGLVGQEPIMFKATIMENIMYGHPNANALQVSVNLGQFLFLF